MQYLLTLYVNEAGWPTLSKAEQEQGVATYTAYTEAITKAGVLKGANRDLSASQEVKPAIAVAWLPARLAF
jgi:hypothetical protein